MFVPDFVTREGEDLTVLGIVETFIMGKQEYYFESGNVQHSTEFSINFM